MKSLDEFNAERREKHREHDAQWNKPRLNGIACPKCGAELKDSCPAVTLTSNPPQKHVHCDACGYQGHRVA